MIEIRDITKTYKTGDLVQRALDGSPRSPKRGECGYEKRI